MSGPAGDDGGGGTTDGPAAEAGGDSAVPSEDVLDELFATIESRREELPEGSYTASLFTHEKGENAVLEKIGEETTEAILAAKDDDREELTAESADLVYHLLVLFAMKDLAVDDLRSELRDRF
ncbi:MULTISPECIES: phosphoribosyl-ATP diphosphatase [Halorubrum]|uniref:Phosphoribosyl-ATP pyrophosphatase n=1 Tax=Halorubrum sodomense TaxID=35743 RepID=A0A1I6FVG3_HALSD|nr:phosphoribosyl-ATP pyrophosphatase [Halorubrum sodomense]